MIAPFLAGLFAGVLSGFGVGGGTLLLVYMTVFAGLPQRVAQGINLLYFLPAAAAALPAHFRLGFVEKKTALIAGASGLVSAGLCAWAATSIDAAWLHRCFGVFLLSVGTLELFRKPKLRDG